MIKNGVDVFRFNFKHNTVDWHSQRIRKVNQIAKKLAMPVGTLIDLQGPEIRINMPKEAITLVQDEVISFGPEVFLENKKGFSISHPQIINKLKEGQKILADDGAFIFFLERKNKKAYLRSKSNGVLKNRKSLNIPGFDYKFPILIKRDFQGLQLAAREEVDFVAISFVRTAEDIMVVRKEAEKLSIKAKIIAKIETEKALSEIDKIIKVSDGIMVARGDMGIEIPIEEVPYYQKIIIKKSIKRGIPVITATQMLQSMITHPYPTRAEVSDVANATYDVTDAVMLSGETAIGKHPVEAVKVMRKTAAFNEKKNLVDSRKRFEFELEDQEAILCDIAYGLYFLYKEKKDKVVGFIVFTHTGRTVRLLSRYRPLVPIFAFTPNDTVRDSLLINFGVVPFTYKEISKKKKVRAASINRAVKFLKEKNLVKRGQRLIILHGYFWAVKGETSIVSTLKVG